MSTIIEQLKARKAAEDAARLEAEAAPAIAAEPTEEEKAAILASLAPAAEPKKPGPPGSYRALRLERFFKATGAKVEPNEEGFFIPADAEEATILAHFAVNSYEMVEFQDPDAQAPA